MAAQAWWRRPIWKGRTPSTIRRSSAAGTDCSGCFASSPGLTEFPVTYRRKRPARFTKAANWAIRWLHAYGAAFDNPDLIVACIIGDGEAETGALATSWHSNKFLNPARDGAVLPILHLNGFKIANPTVLARISRQELTELLRGYGYDPHFVEGDDPAVVHQCSRRYARCDSGADSPDSERRAVSRRDGKPGASALADDRLPHARRAGQDRNSSTASRSRVPGARIRSRSPISRTPNI